MFDFSLAELLVVLLVAFVIFGPEEFAKVIKSFRSFSNKIKKGYNKYINYLDSSIGIVEEEKKDIAEYVMDLDGNMRRTYNLDHVMPNIKKNIDDKNKE